MKSKADGEERERGERKEVVRVLVGTGTKVAPQQVIITQLLLQGLTFSPQKDQEAGSSTTTIQPDKVKDKRANVSGKRCSKGTWRQVFQVSGARFSL